MCERFGSATIVPMTDRTANLQRYRHFVRWRTGMNTVYAAIDLACNCSTREPLGRASLEALASGIPVVSFDDAGLCEIFASREGGAHVLAGNNAAFARNASSYLRVPERLASAKVVPQAAAQVWDIDNAVTSLRSSNSQAYFLRLASISNEGPGMTLHLTQSAFAERTALASPSGQPA